MTKPQQKREKGQKREESKWKWTTDEDNILINFKAAHPDLRWKEIIKQGKLKGKNEKSCSHRWNNYLRPGIVQGGFSPQEDLIIIKQMSLPQNSWKSMAEHLPGRAANAIKNRWNTYLKKWHATISDVRRDLLYREEHDVEAWMAELPPLILNVEPYETLIDDFFSEADIKDVISYVYPDDDLIPSTSTLNTQAEEPPKFTTCHQLSGPNSQHAKLSMSE